MEAARAWFGPFPLVRAPVSQRTVASASLIHEPEHVTYEAVTVFDHVALPVRLDRREPQRQEDLVSAINRDGWPVDRSDLEDARHACRIRRWPGGLDRQCQVMRHLEDVGGALT